MFFCLGRRAWGLKAKKAKANNRQQKSCRDWNMEKLLIKIRSLNNRMRTFLIYKSTPQLKKINIFFLLVQGVNPPPPLSGPTTKILCMSSLKSWQKVPPFANEPFL